MELTPRCCNVSIEMAVIMLKRVISKGAGVSRQILFPYTVVGLRKKFIFIHVPKVAGTAVRHVIGEPPLGRQHLPWWVYQQASPSLFDRFYKFSFVRDPVDRVFSGYKYLKLGGNQHGDREVSKYLERYEKFGDFVEGEIIEGSMVYHPIFRPQSWYLCDWNGEVKVDFLGRFESISVDFEQVARRIKLKGHNGLPVLNKTKNVAENISNDVKEMIAQAYKDDYKIFGYFK